MACSGEMLRYAIEHRLRRQLAGPLIDAEARKRGEQTGLDTLVVHALNDVYLLCDLRIAWRSESDK